MQLCCQNLKYILRMEEVGQLFLDQTHNKSCDRTGERNQMISLTFVDFKGIKRATVLWIYAYLCLILG